MERSEQSFQWVDDDGFVGDIWVAGGLLLVTTLFATTDTTITPYSPSEASPTHNKRRSCLH
jgi:hypothetical protein